MKHIFLALILICVTGAVSAQHEGDEAVAAIVHVMNAPDTVDFNEVFYLADDVGNGRRGFFWVNGDPRRMLVNGGYSDITFNLREPRISNDEWLTNQNQTVRDSMYAWFETGCFGYTPVETVPANPLSAGRFEAIGGAPVTILDINPANHADIKYMGFRSRPEVIAMLGNGAPLGFAVTFLWRRPGFGLTDIDNDGNFDIAFVELYMNDGYKWSNDPQYYGKQADGTTIYSQFVTTTHEFGHALGTNHFGHVGRKKTGDLFAAPLAVMNAVSTPDRLQLDALTGRDKAMMCVNWGSW